MNENKTTVFVRYSFLISDKFYKNKQAYGSVSTELELKDWTPKIKIIINESILQELILKFHKDTGLVPEDRTILTLEEFPIIINETITYKE